MLTYQEFLLRFPELEGVEEVLFNFYLEDAKVEMGTVEERWVNFYNMAQAYLIAHYITLYKRRQSGNGSATYPVKQKEVDDVVVAYGVGDVKPNQVDLFTTTIYGQEYIRWRRMAFAGPRVA